MADGEQNEVLTHILTLKNEVLRWAAPKKHNDSTDGEKYGQASETNFGHVLVKNTVTNSEHPVKGSGIISYINTVKDSLQAKLNIETSISDGPTDETNGKNNIPTSKAVLDKINSKLNNYQVALTIQNTKIKADNLGNNKTIPTVKAVWETLSSYKDLLVGVDLSMPQSYTGSINGLTTAGYYIMNHNKSKPKYFSYGGETIYYTNALVTVKKQSNRVIQHVCATTKVTSSSNASNYTYKINGTEYTRYGSYNASGETTWKPWHLTHKPYSKTSRVHTLGQGVDSGSVVVYENTEGFIIRWKQSNPNQQRYPVHASLYEYADVCTFSPALPINGPYVFGNLIGRMDIRITPNKMQIRSNVAPGGRIIGMDETYFIPRNQ